MGLYGLLRILLIAAAVWWLYKLVRKWLDDDGKKKAKVSGQTESPAGEVEVMVQDPFCGTYLPQSEALRSRIAGEDVHFCSEKCRQGYLDALEEQYKQSKEG